MKEQPNFRSFLSMSHTELWEKLADCEQELVAINSEIALCEADQIRGRSAAYQRSEQASATGRNQEAEVATSTLASTLVELHADKGSLLEEKFFIVRLLDA